MTGNMVQIARWARRRAKRLLNNRSGVVALEFVLVAPILFFLLFAILETSFLYLTATVMEGEVATAARTIRTGAVQQDADPAAYFEEVLCKNLESVLTCDNVVFDIRRFDSFESMSFDEFLDEDGEADDVEFNPGDAGDVVLVRIAYKYTIITPFLAEFLSPDGSGTIVLKAAAAFQNEPFQNAI
jgi:Flp pilus assembly protein TadG